MILNRNTDLYPQVKSVSIRPIDIENSILKSFEEIYSTPSKIAFNTTTSLKAPGPESKIKLSLVYPGLKESDFEVFYDLNHQKYVVKIEFINLKVYQISTVEVPLSLKTSFSQKTGTTLELFGLTFQKIKYLGTSEIIPDIGFPYKLAKKF